MRNALSSGVIPRISAIVGPLCRRVSIFSGNYRFCIVVDKVSYMFVTGPNVVKTITHEEATFDDLGGASTHAIKSDVSHFTAEKENECFQSIRKLVSYIPLNNMDSFPFYRYKGKKEIWHSERTCLPDYLE
ncbi:MAG: hypothetical protein IPL16_18700 [Ignavibacteria bacterium]|nr:hypothetical protein [Ignavibacteria bacterium]